MMFDAVHATTRQPGHYGEMDFVKGIAIFSVLLLHTISAHLMDCYGAFHVWQAVPLFFVIAGMTSALSARGTPGLRGFYSLPRLTGHARRILVPFGLICAVEIAILFAAEGFSFKRLVEIPLRGGLGPGSYFTPNFIQHLLLFPLAVALIRRLERLPPWGIAASFFAMAVALEWLCVAAGLPEWIYRLSYVRYFFAAVLGYLLVARPLSSGTTLLLALSGALYIWAATYGGLEPPLLYPAWRFQHAPSYGYTALLVLALWVSFPRCGAPGRWVARLGQASFHIFLFQMAWFWGFRHFGLPHLEIEALRVAADIAACILGGLAFYRVEGSLSRQLLPDR